VLEEGGLVLQRHSRNNHRRCYSLFSFCPAKRDFECILNLIKKKKPSELDGFSVGVARFELATLAPWRHAIAGTVINAYHNLPEIGPFREL